MTAFEHHVFVCCNQRPAGHPRGCCDPTASGELRDCFKKAFKAAGLGATVRANQCGCLDQCEQGPVIVIYPQAIWYGPVTPADVPRIVEETIVGGRILEDLQIPDRLLNTPEGRTTKRLPSDRRSDAPEHRSSLVAPSPTTDRLPE